MKKLLDDFGNGLFLPVGAGIIVLVMLPALIVGVAGHHAGLLISLLLLFAVDPVFFVLLGIHAGKWSFNSGSKAIVLCGGAFLLGVGILGMDSDAALRYMAVYLVIAFVAMGLTALKERQKSQQRDDEEKVN